MLNKDSSKKISFSKRKSTLVSRMFYLLLFLGISLVISYFVNFTQIQILSKPILEITPENYGPEIKKKISINDIVSIVGTPDLMMQVSQEPLKKNSQSTIYFYTGLKEYGFDFVVRMKKSKLISSQQNFKGRVININDTDFKNRIKNSLNKEINLNEQSNRSFAENLDEKTKNQIVANSSGQFTNSTLLVLDEEYMTLQDLYVQVFLSVLGWASILIAIFNKKIFY